MWRKERRLDISDGARYCVLCENYMLFEPVASSGGVDEGEYVCVHCGSAMFVDPPRDATDAGDEWADGSATG